jgi:hypothetical protein
MRYPGPRRASFLRSRPGGSRCNPRQRRRRPALVIYGQPDEATPAVVRPLVEHSPTRAGNSSRTPAAPRTSSNLSSSGTLWPFSCPSTTDDARGYQCAYLAGRRAFYLFTGRRRHVARDPSHARTSRITRTIASVGAQSDGARLLRLSNRWHPAAVMRLAPARSPRSGVFVGRAGARSG